MEAAEAAAVGTPVSSGSAGGAPFLSPESAAAEKALFEVEEDKVE
jgi:hypothetical protein